MKTRRLGRDGPVVSAIGLGQGSSTTNFGDNFLDTSDAYARGRHERLIGQAIAGLRHEVVLVSPSRGGRRGA